MYFLDFFGWLVTKFPPPDQINVGLHTNLQIWFVGTIILAVASIFALKYVKEKLKVLLLALWLLFGILLFGLDKKSIYDYYSWIHVSCTISSCRWASKSPQ